MRGNNFCVNDKTIGCVWGVVKTWEELNEIRREKGKIEFEKTLEDWNGKQYAFFWTHAYNYFVEITK